MSKTVDIDEASFDRMVLEAKAPVLVDFWATWCGPCRRVAPIIEQLSEEYDGKVEFGKVDVDRNPSLASKYGLKSIPALLLFKDGELVSSMIGFRTREQIRESLDTVTA